MADFAPPAGPPPPTVPAGYKAVWNDQYKEWFYVNIYTKKSQWDKPTEPAYAPGNEAPPGPPPGQAAGGNTYGGTPNTSHDDEALARRLQAEEEAKAQGSTNRGASDSYYQGGQAQSSTYGQASPYGQSSTPVYGQTQSPAPDTDQKRGFFSKLTGKLGGGAQRPPGQQAYGSGYPQQGYQQQQYGQQYPQQGGYGGYPPQQQGYYPPQGQYQQQKPAKHGMGAGGGALLGAGAGLVGGALLMDAVEDHDQNEYDQGYQQGAAGDDGGDDGGDDFGGGDDGGDF